MAVSYSDVQTYARNLTSICNSAAAELNRNLATLPSMGAEQQRLAIQQIVRNIMNKFGLSAQELGAQWYEYAAAQAGVNVNAALISELDTQAIEEYAVQLIDGYLDDEQLTQLIQDSIKEAARQATIENLDRDSSLERRARRPARAGYARVPVGETCAWCLMLASLGYWYRSEETALGLEPDHYHAGCDCVAVPYTEPDDIGGYDEYNTYLEMYSQADKALRDNDISDELQARIDRARAKHELAYERGQTKNKWTYYNELLIVMRDQQHLEH